MFFISKLALSFALTQSFGVTRKWPIRLTETLGSLDSAHVYLEGR